MLLGVMVAVPVVALDGESGPASERDEAEARRADSLGSARGVLESVRDSLSEDVPPSRGLRASSLSEGEVGLRDSGHRAPKRPELDDIPVGDPVVDPLGEDFQDPRQEPAGKREFADRVVDSSAVVGGLGGVVDAGAVRVRVPGAAAPGDVRVNVATAPREVRDASDVGLAFLVEAGPARAGAGDLVKAIEIEVDLSEYEGAYGAGWLTRAELVMVEDCGPSGCRRIGTVDAELDFEDRSLTAELSSEQLERLAGTGEDSRLEAGGANGGGYFILGGGSGDGSGEFAASPIQSLGVVDVSVSSGSASYRYPIELPAATAGRTPDLDLVYSSAVADGLNSDTSAQAGIWVWAGRSRLVGRLAAIL